MCCDHRDRCIDVVIVFLCDCFVCALFDTCSDCVLCAVLCGCLVCAVLHVIFEFCLVLIFVYVISENAFSGVCALENASFIVVEMQVSVIPAEKRF